MQISRTVNVSLSPEETLKVVAQFARQYPDLTKLILDLKGEVNCQCAFSCSQFPCKNLSCDFQMRD